MLFEGLLVVFHNQNKIGLFMFWIHVKKVDEKLLRHKQIGTQALLKLKKSQEQLPKTTEN